MPNEYRCLNGVTTTCACITSSDGQEAMTGYNSTPTMGVAYIANHRT